MVHLKKIKKMEKIAKIMEKKQFNLKMIKIGQKAR